MQEQIYQPQNNALIDWLVYSMKKKIQSKEWGAEIRETVCSSIECCKKANQSNMIDWANQNKGTYHMEPMRKVKASKPPARMWETNYKSRLAKVLLLIG